MSRFQRIRQVRRLVRETVAEWHARDVSLLASALAYSTVFSLAPLMIIVIMLVGAIFGEATAQEQIVAQLTGLLGKDGAHLIATAIANLRLQTGAGPIQLVLNLAILFFGASGVFAQIQDALDRIWEVKPMPRRFFGNLIRKRLLSFVMILGITFLLLVSPLVNTLLATVAGTINQFVPGLGHLWQLLRWLLGYGVTSLIFAAIYTVLPDAEVTWQNTVTGALLTALLFTAGQTLFELFFSITGFGSAYGVASSFVIVITWIFFAAQILFLGAAFTKVFAQQRGVPILPAKFAVSTAVQPGFQARDVK